MFSYQLLRESNLSQENDFDVEIFWQFLKDAANPAHKNVRHWFLLNALRYYFHELKNNKKKKLINGNEKIILIPEEILLNIVYLEIFLQEFQAVTSRFESLNSQEKRENYKRYQHNLSVLNSFIGVLSQFPIEHDFKEAYEGLIEVEKKIRPTKRDSLLRGIVTFNAGYATMNFIMGVVGSFILTPLTLGVSAVVALLFSVLVARHHYHSNYTLKDHHNKNRIKENKKLLRVSARENFQKKRACLNILNDLMQHSRDKPLKRTNSKHANLIITVLNQNTSLEEKLNFLASRFPSLPEPKQKLDNLKIHPTPDLYTKVLTHRIWGPILGFLSAVPSIYATLKLVTTVMGVTFLGLSTLGAGLAMLGVSAAVGMTVFAAQQHVIKKQTARSQTLDDYYEDRIKNAKAAVFKLDRIKDDLTLFSNVIRLDQEEKYSHKVAGPVNARKIHDDYALLSRLSFIKQPVVKVERVKENKSEPLSLSPDANWTYTQPTIA